MSDRVLKYGERIPQEVRNRISMRYHTVTQAINGEFWNSESDTLHSFYVGSYGRNTAINTSDIDILVELPNSQFYRFDNQSGNGQSRLLQAVRKAILEAYPRSDVRADGQIVKIIFYDGIYFEILPAFKNEVWQGFWDGTYKYPDSNMGGHWKSTNPKAEQKAMAARNNSSNGLLYDTCRHIRYIHDNKFSSYHLSGIVIDSFVYNAIGNWQWARPGEVSAPNETYEQVLLNYFNQYNSYWTMTLNAPGSNDRISTESSVECLGQVLNSMV